MSQKLTISSDIKKGKTQVVKLMTHEIEFGFGDTDESKELIFNLYSDQAKKSDGIPSLDVMYNTYQKNVITKLSELIDEYQTIHPLQEGESFHYSLNGESVHSTRSQAESKDIVLQVAKRIVQENHIQLIKQIKEILNKSDMTYRNEQNFVINPTQKSVW